ncbi:REF/SRPP-like protein [Raphanus sativus]|uniref:REF/SRPP-like protein At2g47780 n=1 Tax=Raphanus sativus TaxID=3726 RepID=A0A6J0K1E5_RAPSA|nr:REF/SRPP-like protein At2g47780 [Raphanus sativus]KAJ4892551.1 REF/SRPP-like protein [Raphanus sativus]
MAEDEIVVEEEVPPSSSSLIVEEDDGREELEHLGFVRTAATYLALCLSTLYELAKDNAGPLKLGVENIEATVEMVLSPLYDKFNDVPFKLLLFVDRKVDDVLYDVETYVPSLVKQASSQALTVATEVQRAGVLDTTKSIARSVCDKYEPVAEYYAATVWRLLNRVPLFPQVAQLVIPTAFYWSDKYNDAVRYVGDRDYYVAEYLPMIPIEKISDILEQDHCRAH